MSSADGIAIQIEEIVARLVAEGLRDPAWIANAYIERIDPDRKLPDLSNGACAAYVQHLACQQLGVTEPRDSAYPKPALSTRTRELRNALEALRRHADELQLW